jgi:hypothetical protein
LRPRLRAQFILIGTDVLLVNLVDLNHVSFAFIEQDTEDASQFHHWIVNSVTWIHRIEIWHGSFGMVQSSPVERPEQSGSSRHAQLSSAGK